MAIALIFWAIVGFPLRSFAIPFECWYVLAEVIDPSESRTFANAGTVLFLADGEPSHTGLAERVAAMNPGVRVVKGDVAIRGTTERGNLTLAHVDNTQRLPFADNTFDQIVMRSGLCRCVGDACCGGINPTRTGARQFLAEVARVLNKNNPRATAYLEGAYGNTEETIANWEAASADIMRANPRLLVELIRSQGESGIFRGIRISVRP